METMFEGMLGFIFGLEKDLVATAQFIKLVPFAGFTDAGTSAAAGTVGAINTTLQSVGITLLIFFFFYGFLKKTVMFEFTNWENVVKVLLRFLIAKFILQNCGQVLEALAVVVNGIIDIIPQTALDAHNTPDSQVMIKDLVDDFKALGLIDKIFFFLKYALAWLVMMVVRGVIYIVIYGRFIEICIYTAIAPIPLATLVDEDSSQIAKKFLQGYIAVLLQGVLILIMCFIYVGLVEGFVMPDGWAQGQGGDLLQYIVCSIVLLLTILKSGGWAKQVVGL